MTDKKHNYVYLITEITTDMKYIGSRGTNLDHPMDDLKKYCGSIKNSDFYKRQKENPENFIYEILSLHETRQEAYDEEAKLHEEINVKDHPEYVNKYNHSNKFTATGYMTVKDKNNNMLFVETDDPRIKSGELMSVFKEMGVYKNVKTNEITHLSIYDEKVLNGEFVGHTKTLSPVIDKNGNTCLMSKGDERFKSGEYHGILKNKTIVKDKDGNKFSVSVDDPRLKSGELVGHSKGYKFSEEAKQKMSETRKGENNSMHGKRHSEESRRKMSESQRNRFSKIVKPIKNKPKYDRFKPVNINGQKYNTIKHASDSLNVTYTAIQYRCKSNNEKWKSWYFIIKEKEDH